MALLIPGCGGGCDDVEHGEFVGKLDLRHLADDRMELLEDFAYVDSHGKRWTAKKGDKTDGASIPQAAWSIVGGPFSGQHVRAAVVHDRYCIAENRDGETWQEVHWMFLEALCCAGVSGTKAKTLYGFVYHFGRRWGEDEKTLTPVWRTKPPPRPSLPPLAGRAKDAPARVLEVKDFQKELVRWKQAETTRWAPMKKRFDDMERWIRETNPTPEEIRKRKID